MHRASAGLVRIPRGGAVRSSVVQSSTNILTGVTGREAYEQNSEGKVEDEWRTKENIRSLSCPLIVFVRQAETFERKLQDSVLECGTPSTYVAADYVVLEQSNEA